MGFFCVVGEIPRVCQSFCWLVCLCMCSLVHVCLCLCVCMCSSSVSSLPDSACHSLYWLWSQRKDLHIPLPCPCFLIGVFVVVSLPLSSNHTHTHTRARTQTHTQARHTHKFSWQPFKLVNYSIVNLFLMRKGKENPIIVAITKKKICFSGSIKQKSLSLLLQMVLENLERLQRNICS